MDYAGVLVRAQARCSRALRELDPKRIVREDPTAFFGVHPGRREWQQVLAAFESFVAGACGNTDVRQLVLDRYVMLWRENLTEKDASAVLEFLKSSPGVSFSRALDAVGDGATDYYQELTSEKRDAALKAFRVRVREIAEGATLTR